MKHCNLAPTKRPSVELVGEFAYENATKRLSTGNQYFDLVPEPDNPHDDHAISARHNGEVVGYIPRGQTKKYWSTVARIAASHMTARVKGKVTKKNGEVEISLYLVAGEKAIQTEVGLIPRAETYRVPNAYGRRLEPATNDSADDDTDYKMGCVVLVVLLVLIVGGCRALFGMGDDDEDTAPTVSTETTATTTMEETPTVSDAEVGDWARSVVGGGAGEEWTSIATKPGVPAWAYAVNRVYYGQGGNIVFTMQLDSHDKETAESIGNLYANALRMGEKPAWAEGVQYIIVENAVGEYIKQVRV